MSSVFCILKDGVILMKIQIRAISLYEDYLMS